MDFWSLLLCLSSTTPDSDCKQKCFLFSDLFLVFCCFVLVSTTVPKWVHQAVAPIVVALEKYVPQPYAGEIRGMASNFGGSLSDIIILNFAYEISACV